MYFSAISPTSIPLKQFLLLCFLLLLKINWQNRIHGRSNRITRDANQFNLGLQLIETDNCVRNTIATETEKYIVDETLTVSYHRHFLSQIGYVCNTINTFNFEWYDKKVSAILNSISVFKKLYINTDKNFNYSLIIF